MSEFKIQGADEKASKTHMGLPIKPLVIAAAVAAIAWGGWNAIGIIGGSGISNDALTEILGDEYSDLIAITKDVEAMQAQHGVLFGEVKTDDVVAELSNIANRAAIKEKIDAITESEHNDLHSVVENEIGRDIRALVENAPSSVPIENVLRHAASELLTSHVIDMAALHTFDMRAMRANEQTKARIQGANLRQLLNIYSNELPSYSDLNRAVEEVKIEVEREARAQAALGSRSEWHSLVQDLNDGSKTGLFYEELFKASESLYRPVNFSTPPGAISVTAQVVTSTFFADGDEITTAFTNGNDEIWLWLPRLTGFHEGQYINYSIELTVECEGGNSYNETVADDFTVGVFYELPACSSV